MSVGPIPDWLIKLVLEELAKLLTPERIAAWILAAKHAVYGFLLARVKATTTDVDDKVLEIIAKALGLDSVPFK